MRPQPACNPQTFGYDGVSPLTDTVGMGGDPEEPTRKTEVLRRKSPESRILQKELDIPSGSQAAALCNMLFFHRQLTFRTVYDI